MLVGNISLAGTDPNAAPFNGVAPANGIEQCKFNPRNGYFYLAIPTTGATGDGYLLKISQPVMSTPTHLTTPAAVVAAYDIVPATTGCGSTGVGGGPAGLSIGPNSNTAVPPNGYIVLGCGKLGTGSVIIDDYGTFVATVGTTNSGSGPNTNATDETWYDPAGNHFFLAGSGTGPDPGVLGVVDAGGIPPAGGQEDGDAGTIGGDPVSPPPGTGSHSVAVYSGSCSPVRASRVYVPIRSNTSQHLCSWRFRKRCIGLRRGVHGSAELRRGL
jgi:hypothetical protein